MSYAMYGGHAFYAHNGSSLISCFSLNATDATFYLPVSTSIAPTIGNHLTNKTYVDGLISGLSSTYATTSSTNTLISNNQTTFLGLSNTWSATTNTFSGKISSNSCYVTTGYSFNDAGTCYTAMENTSGIPQVGKHSLIFYNNFAGTYTNIIFKILDVIALTIDKNNGLTSTLGASFGSLSVSGTSSFTGISTFTAVPVCSTNATSANQLCNYQTVTSLIGSSVSSASANTWTGVQNYSNSINQLGLYNHNWAGSVGGTVINYIGSNNSGTSASIVPQLVYRAGYTSLSTTLMGYHYFSCGATVSQATSNNVNVTFISTANGQQAIKMILYSGSGQLAGSYNGCIVDGDSVLFASRATQGNATLCLCSYASGSAGIRILGTMVNFYTASTGASGGSFNYYYGNVRIGYISETFVFTKISDLRMKKNILPLKYGLKEILQIETKQFNYNYEPDNAVPEFGMISQDIEKIMPELITTSETDGIDDKTVPNAKSMDYMGLIPVLINAIQEQDKKINEMSKLINDLNDKLTLLINTNQQPI
jgi:hypothetical protein